MEYQFLQTALLSLKLMGKKVENFESHQGKPRLIAVPYVANFAVVVVVAVANQTD
jgi:hypothetical protein